MCREDCAAGVYAEQGIWEPDVVQQVVCDQLSLRTIVLPHRGLASSLLVLTYLVRTPHYLPSLWSGSFLNKLGQSFCLFPSLSVIAAFVQYHENHWMLVLHMDGKVNPISMITSWLDTEVSLYKFLKLSPVRAHLKLVLFSPPDNGVLLVLKI